ncbi:thioesterase II family protein [Actinokineospora iranica]|uniref:Surfactin synthase thioesterase subunit n=1 Tax=Actinokineospora iranica TaxID=1271860 RepID=A0A1G6Z4R1_9PSEU|nr:alpha/beta fold hydrolase [Actinokineospora iranica]SDD96786.1 Surfactin synthase thioesterase subunit [Actinokineospora iranica]
MTVLTTPTPTTPSPIIPSPIIPSRATASPTTPSPTTAATSTPTATTPAATTRTAPNTAAFSPTRPDSTASDSTGPAPVTLVCFHHAGGTASVFREWRKHAGPELAVHAVQLPGRESRMGEPRHTDLDTLVEALLPELAPVLAGPHVFFGHSMGALVAYRVAHRRLELGLRAPEALAVASYVAPHLDPVRIAVDEVSDVDLATHLCDIDGLRPELLRRPDWLGPLLAVVKDDLRVCASDRRREIVPLPIPLHAFGGTSDPLVTPAQLAAWREHTTAGFHLVHLPGGGHFLVTQRGSEMRERVFDLALRRARAHAA